MLVVLCAAFAGEEDSVCDHSVHGNCRRVSLDEVERGQAEVKRRLTATWEKAVKLSADSPFDSGLPSCVQRRTRRFRTPLPPQWVGKTAVFARSDRMPRADIRVATFARRIGDLDADALADRRLIERLGVSCAPTLVRGISEVEIELVENP